MVSAAEKGLSFGSQVSLSASLRVARRGGLGSQEHLFLRQLPPTTTLDPIIDLRGVVASWVLGTDLLIRRFGQAHRTIPLIDHWNNLQKKKKKKLQAGR